MRGGMSPQVSTPKTKNCRCKMCVHYCTALGDLLCMLPPPTLFWRMQSLLQGISCTEHKICLARQFFWAVPPKTLSVVWVWGFLQAALTTYRCCQSLLWETLKWTPGECFQLRQSLAPPNYVCDWCKIILRSDQRPHPTQNFLSLIY